MGVIQNLSQVKQSLQEAGDNVADTTVGIGKAIGRYICSIYNDYPYYLTGEGIDPLGYVSSYRKSLFENLCGPPDAPPPPGPQFPGGQCPCTRYQGTVVVRYQVDVGTGLETGYANFGVDLFGPVGGFSLETPSGGGVTVVSTCGGYGTGTCILPPVKRNFGSLSGGLNHSIQSVSLGPVAGYPDNCGNLPGPPPPTPTDTDLNQTFVLNIGPNNVSVDFNFTKVAVNATFPLNFDVNLKFDTTFEGGSDDDIIFNFGPEGVTGPNQPILPPNKQPPVSVKLPVYLDIKADIDINNYDIDLDDEDDPKEKEAVERLGYVEVVLTVVPRNVASQWGGPQGAPDVFYSGWFEFKRGSYAFPRQPIHFKSSVFKAPIGADGYAYTVYEGFQAYAVTYTYKEEN